MSLVSSASLRWIAAGLLCVISVTAHSDCNGLKGWRDFSNRCEGKKDRPNALEDFKLIGIHRSFQPFGVKADLKVGFFAPLGADVRSISLKAVEAQDSTQYSMESKDSFPWKSGWNVFQPWPTKDVIDQLRLQSENIAVLASYRTATGHSVFLPVDVSSSNPTPLPNRYTFRFRIGQDLQPIDLLLLKSAGGQPSIQKELDCKPKEHPGCYYKRAGDTLTFDLDMTLLPEGEYRLKLVGHNPEGSITSAEVLLYHPDLSSPKPPGAAKKAAASASRKGGH